MTKKYKVIHSCTSLSFSGLERYVLDLADWQNRNQVDVLLVCRESSELFEHAKKRNIPTWTITKDVKKGPLAWLQLKRGWKELNHSDKNIILHMHAGGEPQFHLPWLIARPKNLSKIILQFHLWITLSKHDLWHRFIYSRIDEVWCSSASAKKQLIKILPFTKKYRAVNYGRNIQKMNDFLVHHSDSRNQLRKEFGIPSSAILFLNVSRIEPIKGALEYFESFCNIAKKNENIYALLVGDVSPNNAEAKICFEKIKSQHLQLPQNIQKRFIMPGYRSDYLELLNASDFYVLPSYEECMSLALLDALIMGLPVVGTNSGGTPFVVRENENGFLVEPQSVHALEIGLQKAYEVVSVSSEKYKTMVNQSKAIGELHDQEKIFKTILLSYQESV